MNDIKEFLHKRICEYNQKWQYQPGSDMAACLLDIVSEYLLQQQARIEQIPIQKQKLFWNMLSFMPRSSQHQYACVSFKSKNSMFIPPQATLFAQDESGNEEAYELTKGMYVQNGEILGVMSVDGVAQKICCIAKQQPIDIILSVDDKGEQCNALYFYIPHMFDHCEDLAFDLCLSCEDTLWDYLLQSTHTKLYLEIKEELIELLQVTRKENALHISIDLCEEQRLHITGLWIKGMDLSQLSPQRIWDASFLWHGTNLRCDYIFGEEQAYESEEAPLFGAPMNICNSCYISENETLFNPDAMVTLHFNTRTKCIDQGMELLQQQEFRGIMRKLPLDLVVYDAYADVVVMEYFNGKAWCTLPNTKGIQSIFTQAKESVFQVSFKRPSDLQPCTVMGKFAYYLRFRLVKSDHLYQQPCHVHVPYISHVRFQYTMCQKKRAKQTLLYTQLQKEDISARLGNKGCVLFSKLQAKGKAIFIGLSNIDPTYPCTLYFDITHSKANGAPLRIALAQVDSSFQELHIVDETDGLRHSGIITIMFPEQIEPIFLFNKSAYWLRLSFCDEQLYDIHVHKIEMNCAVIKHKEGRLDTISSIRLEDKNEVEVSLIHGPYGGVYQLDERQDQKRIAHQFTTMQHPICMKDIKQYLLYEYVDIADICILENLTAFGEDSKNCHILLLMKEEQHHHQLFHLHKKDVLAYFKKFEACIQGQYIVEEVVFVTLSLHIKARTVHQKIWEKQQALLQEIITFLSYMKGGLLHKGFHIGERLDMEMFKQHCLKHIEDIECISWQSSVTFQKQGRVHTFIYEEMPILPGMILINGHHCVEMEDTLC